MAVIDGTSGDETLNGTSGDDTINGLAGNDVLNGLAGNDTLNGGDGTDTLNGGDGNDTLNGGAGADTMNGGAGDDIYYVDHVDDDVSEALYSGTDIVNSSVTFSLVGTQVENLTLTGIDHIDATGNDLANTLTGNSGNNKLRAGQSDDILSGGAGNDTLEGGGGHDTLDGGEGNDTYEYTGRATGFDSITDSGTGGTDRLVATADETSIGISGTFSDSNGIEEISGNGKSDVWITGSAVDNTWVFTNVTLTDIAQIRGNWGIDDITGSIGDDSFFGSRGNDTLDGGAGNDSAIYSGNIANYDIDYDPLSGKWTVEDLSGILGSGEFDGTDTLSDIETLVFADGSVSLIGTPTARSSAVQVPVDGEAAWALSADGGAGVLTYSVDTAATALTTVAAAALGFSTANGDVFATDHGHIQIKGDGTYDYKAVASYTGTDSFDFKVTDSLANTSSATVNVGVGNLSYRVEHSVDFEKTDSDYLKWSPTAASGTADSGKKFTWSGWVKRESTGSEQALFGVGDSTSSSVRGRLQFDSSNKLLFRTMQGGAWRGMQTSETYTDTTAWHHIVLSVDTTNATAADRIKIYVDGVRQSDSGAETDHDLNDVTAFGGTEQHEVGSYVGVDQFDGQMADVRFVDGDALGASAFGSNGGDIWGAEDFAGSHGDNGFHLDFANSGDLGNDVSENGADNNFDVVNTPSQSGDGPPAPMAEIGYSVDLEKGDSQYLSRTLLTASGETDSGEKFTWSGWVKRESTGSEQALFGVGDSTSSSVRGRLQFDNTNRLLFRTMQGGAWRGMQTSETYTDTTAWHHIVLSVDTTNGTAADRVKIYVDGVRQTDSGAETDHGLNDVTAFGGTERHEVGSYVGVDQFDGLMADVHFVDGDALDQSAFGSGRGNVWAAENYTGSHGDNGFHLDFAASGDLGNDVAGGPGFSKHGTPVLVQSAESPLAAPLKTTIAPTDYNDSFEGFASDDVIDTGAGDDQIIGSGGDDTLTGGTGNDTYKFARGDDADVIDNAGESASDDVVEFGATIDHDQLWFQQVGNDLKVSVIGTTDSITVDEWFTGTSNQLDFEAGNAYSLTDANVASLVTAMSSFTAPTVGQTELSDAFAGQDLTDLTASITANWQS